MGADGWWVKVVCEVVVEGGGRDVGVGRGGWKKKRVMRKEALKSC